MNARDHLALALDVDDLDRAVAIASTLQPFFSVAKIGLELFSSAGPQAVGTIRALGYDIFLDVKLHDIPNTVGQAARVLGRLGVRYLTLHASGGRDMLAAGVAGLSAGAADRGLPAPRALGVTVLTSDPVALPEVFEARVGDAVAAGCGGLVCAVAEAPRARVLAPALVIVTPGIRPGGVAAHDQGRPATPAEAIAAGADLLVIGRAVTGALDPGAAAQAIVDDINSTTR
jgi:orotidine-5'-phosphate decarboxylase